ncbi:hypothetical protein BDA96_02G373500 [Sorghum bicolor]|jgi:hypothetical protein|uniref:DUF7950 domain-containing protein n=2 Tax=Sorghum bicolor TaxID=4558 RepID=A0A921RSW9_SORBI|nr:uncharacterized protein LOC8058367 [Sorghum bicolor]EER97457.1 hypothetical protein SORBI_3002G356300 [Sorghum bicolor]KAG0545582.1 hypothetical protein BDA96_02G373500 [Sorghum bicolor]|eukprot:XP_002460936.1 uncharacterized protein LOC8058367 [Sorghum bicolor]
MAMVQPADTAVKANEILARFRPIAPKPTLATAAAAASPVAQAAAEGVVAANRVLCHLQSRPCRARKRGRPTVVPVSPPKSGSGAQSPAKRKRAATPYPPLRCAAATACSASAVVPVSARLPLASLPPASAGAEDLAKVAAAEGRDVPVERDLLRKLLEPKVISPRAVRPVCSAIHVGCIHRTDATCTAAASKTAAQVEAELEVDALPAVVSDSSNRVRLVNDAYKEMVGQPECPWLYAVAATSRRISGEVALVVADQSSLPETYGVFTCTAKIEWEDDGKVTSIAVPCDVSRLHCESRDYLFTWRFRTADADASVGHSSEEISES